MSALILYCATSVLHVPHRHAPGLIDMVVPVSHRTGRCHVRSAQGGLFDVPRSRMVFGSAISWLFFVQNCEFRFFVQNAKFRDFVRFSFKTNFLCPYISLLLINYYQYFPFLFNWPIVMEFSQLGRVPQT